MWCIVGLGNPGAEYQDTRHNVGFMVAERMAHALGVRFREHPSYRMAEGAVGRTPVLIVEPLTFMNRSGIALAEVLRRRGPEDVVLVHDDIDMETGRIRIRKGGSSGGHRGVQSVIDETGGTGAIRLKVGIGRERGTPVREFVLDRFSPGEREAVERAVEEAVQALMTMVREGVGVAMNRFNRKPARTGDAPPEV
jgi:PTH1 family peptidyl-tRNA hydrolase